MLKMNSAKSYKILILLIATVMLFVTAFSFMSSSSAYAEESSAPSSPNYIKVYDGQSNEQGSKATYQSSNIKVAVEKDYTVEFVNQLVLAQETAADLNLELIIPDGMKLKLVVTAEALDQFDQDEGENKKVVKDKVYVDTIFEITKATDFDATANQDIRLGLEEDFITLNGASKGSKKVNVVANKVAVSIKFIVEQVGSTKNFDIVSVNQFASASNTDEYKQTFEVNDKGELTKTALPRVMLPKAAYAKTESGYVLRKIDGNGYDFNYGAVKTEGYSLTSSKISADSFEFVAGDFQGKKDYSITLSIEKNSKFLTFNLTEDNVAQDMSFDVKWNNKVVETFDVEVIPITSDQNKAPTMDNSNEELAKSYQKALEQKAMQEGTDHSVPLGKSFVIPSMDAFLLDDNASYNDLTRKYYYVTPSTTTTQSSTTSMKLDVAGKYMVYCIASEKVGDTTLEMESNFYYDVKAEEYLVAEEGDDFTKAKPVEKGSQAWTDALTDNGYFIYVFTFEIKDDAPIKVIPGENDNGFVGVTYKVQKFNTSDNTNAVYKLYYHSNVNAKESDNGWKEIISKNNIPENGANGYTYDELSAIGFDSSALTFTPDKVGAYRVECVVTSRVQSGKNKTVSTIIQVKDEPTVVEVPNYWFRDNLASIIFLGVGTLCLIGIIVLICIKPKDELDVEVDNVVPNKKKNSTK